MRMKHPLNETTIGDEISMCRSSFLCVLLLVSAVVLILLDLVEINYYSYLPAKMYNEESNQVVQIQNIQQQQHGFLVKTEGCRIPAFDPFDSAVQDYIEYPSAIVCHNKTNPPLILSDLTTIFINENALDIYNYTKDKLKCCYSPFWRREPKKDESDTKSVLSKKCITFYDSVQIKDEFIKVMCKTEERTVYTDVFSFVPPTKIETKIQQVRKSDKKDYLSVLLVGIDAVSRINLHRQMPRTVDFLLNKLKAKEMLGYNKVGDNTYPNLMPVLTGLSEDEVKNVCLSNVLKSRFDSCPFIWQTYSDAGYATAYGEDETSIGLFNYFRNGFRKQSVDYDWRIFNKVAIDTIGHNKNLNTHFCLGSRFQFDVLLDYTTKFATTFKNQPYFGFFWQVSLSHDYLNYPALGDDKYATFFENLSRDGILNNTVVVFLSDHGIRWGSIRKTYQGRMEERLPFLFFIFPDWVNEKYPNAISSLVRNTRALTTPFDLHSTLNDLLQLENLEQDILRKRSELVTPLQRGISLFLPISKNRTCEMAGITDHWCTCQKQVQGNTSDKYVMGASKFVVSYMNNLLKGYAECSKLKLNEIISVYQSDYHKELIADRKDTMIVDYTLVLKTEPGQGLFEATVRHKKNADYDKWDFSLTGTISRINLYGSQSKCITDFHLKLYCYCL